MRTITIEFAHTRGFDVVDEYGRRCNGLCFGEMLEQVTGLVHPSLGEAPYRMLTEEQWQDQLDKYAMARGGDL